APVEEALRQRHVRGVLVACKARADARDLRTHAPRELQRRAMPPLLRGEAPEAEGYGRMRARTSRASSRTQPGANYATQPRAKYAPLVPASARYKEILERQKKAARAFVDPEAPHASLRSRLEFIQLAELAANTAFAYVRQRLTRGITRAEARRLRAVLR